MAIEKLKRYESPGIDQIPAELIKSWSRTIRSEIRQLVNSIWNKEQLPEEWKESIIGPIYWKGDKETAVIIEPYHFGQLHTKCYPTACVKANSICRGNYWEPLL
jgi:hypothetical protein